MTARTSIEWTDSTFNPWIGCTKVSPGCDNCYAARQDGFRKWTPAGWGAGHPRKRTKTWGEPEKWNERPFAECTHCGWRGEAPAESFCENCGRINALRETRRRVFCASLADVFDNEVPDQWRHDLFRLILDTPHLDWLLLTKRIGNVAKMLDADQWEHLGNVWLGATIVNQEEADRDIPKLLATPARVRFLSMEPLLGEVTLRQHLRPWPGYCQTCGAGLSPPDATSCSACGCSDHDEGYGRRQRFTRPDWVIVGGESGPHARPMHPDWARSLRDQCAAAGVPFLFKQWGEWASVSEVAGAGAHHTFPDGATVRRVGKKAAGRLLDGVEHNDFPGVAHA